MDNSPLTILLQKYDRKRQKVFDDLELRKKELYASNKRLEEIENQLNTISIHTVKSMLMQSTSSKEPYLKDLNENIAKLKQERLTILKELGKEESYLEPHYNCSLCNDTGYIISSSQTEMCKCLKQELFNIQYNKSNISNIDKENFLTFDLTYYSDDINQELYKCNISPRQNIMHIKKTAEDFIANFDSAEQKNLLFVGNTGLGKTFLSNCISNELLKQGKVILYQTAPIMFDSIINYRFNKTDINIYEDLLAADLLIIDDLGTENINNIIFTELFNIINSRLLNQSQKVTKTIISTNLDLNNLFSRYDERIVSRFAGYYDICKFFGEDIRFKKRNK